MRKTPEEIAYQLLEHFADIVPYTSYNLAVMSSTARDLSEKVSQYNRMINQQFLPGLSKEAKELASQIQTIANTLRINVDLSKPPGKQITNLPPTFDRGLYLTWYQTVLKLDREKNPSSILQTVEQGSHEYNDYIVQYKNANGPLTRYSCKQLVCYYQHYKTAKELKTGNCGNLARAGIYYLLNQTDYEGNIFLIRGYNVDHAFIVINCDDDKISKNSFSLEDLPRDAMIIDPWTRCKYKASDASEYYQHMPLVRSWWTNLDAPLKFNVAELISKADIKHAREFLEGFDKYLHPRSNSTLKS